MAADKGVGVGGADAGSTEGTGKSTPATKPRSSLAHALRMDTWTALVLWLLVVSVFLGVMPRVFRSGKRRARSGMRAD